MLDNDTRITSSLGSNGNPIVDWNEALLAAVRLGPPAPTIVTRQLSMVHTAMYDAWTSYDSVAKATELELRRPEVEHTYANKLEAISYAAYRTAVEVFTLPEQRAVLDQHMLGLGFDPADTDSDPGTPSGIGNLVAAAIVTARAADGSNVANGYADTTGYTPVNSPDPSSSRAPGGADFDPNHWQPLRVPTGTVLDEAGRPVVTDDPSSYRDQRFVTPQWGKVAPFALDTSDQFRPPAPPQKDDFSPYMDATGKPTTNDAAWREQFNQVLDYNANLTPLQKAIAEFWADGPGTATPPGHWNQLAQGFALRDGQSLDASVKFFFALNNALLDADIAAWDAKAAHDFIRPVSAIRHLYVDQEIDAWGGPGEGTETIPGQDWLPYQELTFVTPAFPEFVSGHSTFSAAAAAVIEQFTESPNFYDGHSTIGMDLDGDGTVDRLGEFVVRELAYEDYDGEPIVLRWDTVYEASDEAGISRLFGGIHAQDGDLFGRAMGRAIGEQAYATSELLFSGIDEANKVAGTLAGNALHGSSGMDVVLGFGGDDRLYANRGDDRLYGGAGHDFLSGGEGNDRLWSSTGKDFLIGGLGDDQLLGGRDDDVLDGGPGRDEVGGGWGDDLGIHDANVVDDGIGDRYDGGGGAADTLRLRLTPDQLADKAVLAELAAYSAESAEHRGCDWFVFESLNELAARNWELIEVEVHGMIINQDALTDVLTV
jgi:hypothetical protein